MDINGMVNKLNNKNRKIIIVNLIVIILSFSAVNVMGGVSAPYWDTQPLVVYPGQIIDFKYSLQNMVGSNDIQMQATMDDNSAKIMQFLDGNSIYNVPLGTKDNYVNMRITIPNDAQQGKRWDVGVVFKTVSTDDSGKAVVINTAVSKGFPVIVGNSVPAPEEVSDTTKSKNSALDITLLIGVLAMLIISTCWFTWRNKNLKKKKR